MNIVERADFNAKPDGITYGAYQENRKKALATSGGGRYQRIEQGKKRLTFYSLEFLKEDGPPPR